MTQGPPKVPPRVPAAVVGSVDHHDMSAHMRPKAPFSSPSDSNLEVCVFITAGPITKLFAGGGGGEWRTCAMRDDEPRPVWMSPLITH